MEWIVEAASEFVPEFEAFDDEVRNEIIALTILLQKLGPDLRRPHCDTLTGSKHANLKELRFRAANGQWRLAFAFDPRRRAILLVAGDKSGVSQSRFYNSLIHRADERFDRHLVQLEEQR